MLSIGMGCLPETAPGQDIAERNQVSVGKWSVDAIRDIERLHLGENDDALERYELMAILDGRSEGSPVMVRHPGLM